MQLTLLLGSCALLTTSLAAQSFQKSDKRGLVWVNNKKAPDDNKLWPPPKTDLTWYYNYEPLPVPAYSNVAQSEFEFVPMLWGAGQVSGFASKIKDLVSGGRNITHVMGFNEPDGDSRTGGSGMAPATAAANWISQIQPLREMGIKVGGPAVTGSPRGHQWLEDFFKACTSQGTNCTIDFLPVHWYGNFEGLASHLGQVAATYPNTSLWVTEYALATGNLADNQAFFRMSAEYMDRIPYVGRYSYFGSFRSDISNVGANAAMLDAKGRLTDIGAWYLGQAATGNIPSAATQEGVKVAAVVAAVMAGIWAM